MKKKKNLKSELEYDLNGRIPLLWADRFVHIVVRPRWGQIKLLCRHHNSSVFSFFQFGTFFSGAFISPTDLSRNRSFQRLNQPPIIRNMSDKTNIIFGYIS